MDKNANSLVYLIYRHVGIKLKKKGSNDKENEWYGRNKKKRINNEGGNKWDQDYPYLHHPLPSLVSL